MKIIVASGSAVSYEEVDKYFSEKSSGILIILILFYGCLTVSYRTRDRHYLVNSLLDGGDVSCLQKVHDGRCNRISYVERLKFCSFFPASWNPFRLIGGCSERNTGLYYCKGRECMYNEYGWIGLIFREYHQ